MKERGCRCCTGKAQGKEMKLAVRHDEKQDDTHRKAGDDNRHRHDRESNQFQNTRPHQHAERKNRDAHAVPDDSAENNRRPGEQQRADGFMEYAVKRHYRGAARGNGPIPVGTITHFY